MLVRTCQRLREVRVFAKDRHSDAWNPSGPEFDSGPFRVEKIKNHGTPQRTDRRWIQALFCKITIYWVNVAHFQAEGQSTAAAAVDRCPGCMGDAEPGRIRQPEFHKPFPGCKHRQIQTGGVKRNGFLPPVTI